MSSRMKRITDEKITTFKTGPPSFNGGIRWCMFLFLSEWHEFPSASCLAGKKNLMRARVSMLLKSRASPDMLPFSLCNKKILPIRHINIPLFPTTLSIPSYDIGNYVGLRSYQHPLVLLTDSLMVNDEVKRIEGNGNG